MTDYRYDARLVRVIDGDTVDLDVDLGFGFTKRDRFRLYGINTPELRASDPEERERGYAAKRHLQAMFDQSKPVFVVFTHKDKQGKYGRYLVTIFLTPNSDSELFVATVAGVAVANDELIKTGNAVPYMI